MSEEALMAALAAEGVELGDDAQNHAKQDDNPIQEPAVSEPAEPELELDEFEVEARAKGWKPNKEEYEAANPGKKWSSAETFLARREMADEISRRGKELKEVTKRLDAMQKQFEQRVQSEVAQRVEALKKERADAIRAQDFEEIDRLDSEIEAAKSTPAVQPPDDDPQQEPQSAYIEPPQLVARFVEKWKANDAPWFDKVNDSIRKEAARVEQLFINTYPGGSVEDALAYVNETMVRKFPELAAFGKKVQTGGAPRGTASAATVDESSLSPADKVILRQLEKQGIFKTAKDKADFIRENFGA